MSKYRERIDDIFEALYGSNVDECDDKYGTDVYYYESLEMEQEFYKYLKCIKLYDLNISIKELATFIVYTDCIHIGSNIKDTLNIEKLEQIVTDILAE